MIQNQGEKSQMSQQKNKNTQSNSTSLFDLLMNQPLLQFEQKSKTQNKNKKTSQIDYLHHQFPQFHQLNKTKDNQQLLKQQLDYNFTQNLAVLNQHSKTIFKKSELNSQYRYHLTQKAETIITQNSRKFQSVCTSYNKYNPEQIRALLYSQKQYDDPANVVYIYSFSVTWGRFDQVIHFLQFKKYAKLKSLNLGANFIQSIELLSRVYMPELEEVFLWKNNITEVRSLKRNNWPNIKSIDLHVNLISEIKDLRYLGNKEIDSILIESNFLVHQQELIVLCSRSPKAKLLINSNKFIKYMGRPKERRRGKAIQIIPCFKKVKYG